MSQEEKTTIEERIVDVLKTVYDPEIPVNIYDLGIILLTFHFSLLTYGIYIFSQ